MMTTNPRAKLALPGSTHAPGDQAGWVRGKTLAQPRNLIGTSIWTPRHSRCRKQSNNMVFRGFWSTALLALGALLGAAPALAQGTTTSTTTTASDLATSDFTMKLQRPDGDDWVDLAKTDQDLYFNQARCRCDVQGTGSGDGRVRIVVQMASASRAKLAGLTTTGAYARLYSGISCAALNGLNEPACPKGKLGEVLGLSTFSSSGSWAVETTVSKLFAGTDCTRSGQTTIYLWIDSKGVGYPDSGVSGGSAPALGITLDGSPPPAPTGVAVEGGNEALQVTWDPLSMDSNVDLAGYVIFCMRGDGLQVFEPSYFKDQYMTATTLCGLPPSTNTVVPKTSIAGTTTAIEVAAPSGFQTLDSIYMCSGRLSSTSNSARIRILQNGIPYTVGVAAVDKSGNISPITSAFMQRPIPTLDFYRAYRDDGGQSRGGYCSLGGGTGRIGWLTCLAGAGLLGLSFIRRHRRRKASGVRGLTLLVLLLAAGAAQAQPVAVSREDLNATFEEPRRAYSTPKSFALELRFGPFRPDVDSEFPSGVTPYKDTFGGKRHVMSQLELDWQLFQSFGSLAVGASVGYYSRSAKALVVDPTTGAPTDQRSGDNTSLRLIPFAGLLVYRFDVLALQWGVPLVPYVKLGLNYTLWRITDGNSSVPSYLGGRGSGGTWGWQTAAGMALMLDFIDSSAARNLDMEIGVNHTYFFFEWNKVAANGLGQSDKLHVGDSRWVLGMMFEF
jgi:hypothetical protein